MNKRVLNPKSVFNTLQYGFSQAVVTEAGRRVHLSGQVGVDEREQTVGTDLKSQAFAAVDNITEILKEAGGSLMDVVMLRIYIVESERDNQNSIMEVLKSRFPDDPPATSWVMVSGLSEPEWLVEIEAEAVLAE